jgi:hypothetical protein
MIIIKSVAMLLMLSNDTVPSVDSLNKPYIQVEHLKAEPFMLTQVSHLSDFVKIFNFGTDSISIKGDTLHQLKTTREAKILQLFDRELLGSFKAASHLKNNITPFLKEISEELILSFPPENLSAKEKVWVNYQSKIGAIEVYLRLLPQRKGYSWFIEEVSADFLKGDKNQKKSNKILRDSSVFIAPNSHETAFLDLFNLIRDQKDLYGSQSPTYDKQNQNFEKFRELVKTGRMKPLYTETPELYLHINPTWVAKLVFVNRKTDNSGWLINDLFFLPLEKKRLKAVFPYYIP